MRTFVLLWPLCIVVLFARRPDLLWAPQFFAEDGVIFYRDAVVGGIASLAAPYAGYHHLVPRAVALAALPFPFAWQPAVYAWITVVVEGAACAALAPLLRSLIADPALRALAALGVAAVVPADEVIGSVANVQWYVALGVVASALVPLRGWARPAARSAAVIVGLTTPQGLVLLPIAAFAWWRRPAGHDPWTATLYVACSLLNVVTAPRAAGGTPTPHLLEALGTVLAFRVGDALVLGKPVAEALAAAPLGGVALGLAVIAVTVALIARTRGALAAAVVGYLIVAPVALVLATRSLPAAGFAGYAFFGADRYFIAPCAALVVALVLIASRIAPVAGARAAAVALLLPGAIVDFREPAQLPNEHWAAQLPALESWRGARDAGGPVREVRVPIPPASWSIDLPPCKTGSRGGALPRCP